MAYLANRLGNRECCLVKELTKTHERVTFCHLADKIDDARGEFVLVVNSAEQQNPLCKLPVEEHIKYYLDGGMKKTDAIKAVAKDRNLPKNEIYKQTLAQD